MGGFDDPGLAGGESVSRSITDVLRELHRRGFTDHLRAVPGGRVRCGACAEAVSASELEVAAFERLEGASDPADMLLVVAATCPSCGAAGALVLTYGPLASPEDSEVEALLPIS